MESTNHQPFTEQIETCLRQQEDVDDVTRTGRNTITSTVNGISTQFIIGDELSTIDKPGTLLHAIETEADPHFNNQLVVPTNEAASKLAAWLKEPVQTVGKRGMRCYVTSTPLEVNGQTVICPNTDNPEWWYSDSKHRLELKTASKTVPISMDLIETSPSLETIPFPRVIETGDAFIAQDETGRNIEMYETHMALTADWTSVRVPYVPIQWDIFRMPIHYFNGGGLVEYQPMYVWDDESEIALTTAVLEEVLSTQTAFRPGAELDVGVLYERVRDRHTYNLNQPAPDWPLFGLVLGRRIETVDRQNPRRKIIPHREWINPIGEADDTDGGQPN